MESSIPINFDVEVLLHRAVVRAVETVLTATHGSFYARTFLEDHSVAIDRVVTQRLHGRSVSQVALDLHSLNKLQLRL